jgi:hypothetical protein
MKDYLPYINSILYFAAAFYVGWFQRSRIKDLKHKIDEEKRLHDINLEILKKEAIDILKEDNKLKERIEKVFNKAYEVFDKISPDE